MNFEAEEYVPSDDSVALRLSPAEERFDRIRRTSGFLLAPLLFATVYLLPFPSLSREAHVLAAVCALVFVLWVTETLPLPVTAVLGPTLAVIFGAAKLADAFQPFGDPIIFLFMGSFMLANAIFIHQLDKRVAYSVLSIKWVGSSPSRILFAFGAICFVLSMWMSNTATTAMMFPIGLSILVFLRKHQNFDPRYGMGLMLISSYAATAGGMGTPVGTPPNLIAIGMIKEIGNRQVTFFQWMSVGLPIALVIFLFFFVYLNKICPAGVSDMKGSLTFLKGERSKLGKWTRGQKNVIAAFCVTVFLWVAPGVVALAAGADSPAYERFSAIFPESVAALIGAVLLFLLPVNWRERKFTMTWQQAVNIDWGTILLFGGGLALGKLAFSTGLAKGLGDALLTVIPLGESDLTRVLALTFFSSFFTLVLSELASNTAATNMALPVVLALAGSLNADYVAPGMAAGLAASLGFMMPVSTPPNAIVFSSGLIPITKMIRYGATVDLAGLLILNAGILLYFYLGVL